MGGSKKTPNPLARTSHQVWTMLEGRGFTGCGKTPSGSRFESARLRGETAIYLLLRHNAMRYDLS
jgi:hypothetical protein